MARALKVRQKRDKITEITMGGAICKRTITQVEENLSWQE